MFGFFTEGIKAGLDVATDSLDLAFGDGEGPSKEDVAKLADAGFNIGAMAVAFGVGEDVIARLLKE